MSAKFKTTWFYAELSSEEKEKGLIKKRVEKSYTQRSVNLDAYARELQKTYEELDAEGYEVINVVPVSMGQSEGYSSGPNNMGIVGFSITRGAVVVGQKKET